MFDLLTEKLFSSKIGIRSLPSEQKNLYLTFDDGPDPLFTSQVLEVLSEFSAKATFFMVAQKAQNQTALVQKVVALGHQIGNHSEDHAYRHFFKSPQEIRSWIERSESTLRQVSGIPTVGFRPPNGVVSPPLLEAMEQLRMPLYLWNHRFFDTLRKWSEQQVLNILPHLQSGDILLLHDRQSLKRQAAFLQTLKLLLKRGSQDGWHFLSLPVNKKES